MTRLGFVIFICVYAGSSSFAQDSSANIGLSKQRLAQLRSSVPIETVCDRSNLPKACRNLMSRQVASCARGLVSDADIAVGERRKVASDSPLVDGETVLYAESNEYRPTPAEAETAYLECIDRTIALATLDGPSEVEAFFDSGGVDRDVYKVKPRN